jgi:hypothetical protein
MRRIDRLFAPIALTVAVGLAFAAGSPSPVRAQGKLDATYTASLAGIPLGRGAWVIDIGDEHFTAVTSGVTTGLLRVFASGQGSGISRGYVSNGTLIPSSYAATITASKKTEELKMKIVGGVIKDLSIDPPSPPQPERIPVTEAHLRGVTDPMTASLLRVPGASDMLAADSCGRSTAIFDGRMRYDLTMAYKRIDSVKADKGYAGPALVCAIYFKPIAGYIPDRAAIRYLTKQRDMEAWLVPIAGTRILVPFRVTIPTPMGTGMLQANQFIATAAPPRSTSTSVKGQ